MKKYKKFFKQIAKENNTSAKEVEKEISLAVLMALENDERTESENLFWKELTKDGAPPTPERVIDALLEKWRENTSSPQKESE